MAKKTSVFIVILNWNRTKDLLVCLESIKKLNTTTFKLRTLVVDNGSSKKNLGLLKKGVKKYDVELIQNKENLGFAQGNNVGIRNALENKADHVLILNNDTTVDKDLVVELLKTSKKYPKAGILSPKIYFASGFEYHKNKYKNDELGKVIWAAGGEMDWENVYGTNRGVDEVDKYKYNKVEEIDFASGACVLLRAKAVKEVGIFNEKFYMYFEDVDLSMRMKSKGWKVMYVPKAKIWHKVAQSSKIGGDLNDYFIARNRLLFGIYYAPFRTKLALLKESFTFVFIGRKWQKIGAMDFYLGRFGKGSWTDNK